MITKADMETHMYLALPEHPVNLSPSTSPAIKLDAKAFKLFAQRVTSFPSIVMRDLARDVVQDVGL